MTTNQTIDGVSRATIEAILKDGSCKPEVNDAYMAARKELRALLDAGAHAHEWDINSEGTATVCHCGARSSDEPAEQPAPVAIVMPSKRDMRPFQTVDRGSTNYCAGWNACLDEVARLNPSL